MRLVIYKFGFGIASCSYKKGYRQDTYNRIQSLVKVISRRERGNGNGNGNGNVCVNLRRDTVTHVSQFNNKHTTHCLDTNNNK